LDAVQGVPGLAADPAPAVVFDTLGESTVGFVLTYWIHTVQADFGAAQDYGLKAVKEAFQREAIALPIAIRAFVVQHPLETS
jgi:small-conductance mechanosensitive channel